MALGEDRMKELRLLLLDNEADTSQDTKIKLLYSYAEQRLRLLLNTWRRRFEKPILILSDPFPEEIAWIIDEVLARRWNRLGSEGMQSESIGGHSVTFEQIDFAEYEDILRDFVEGEEDSDAKRGWGEVIIY